MSKIENKAGDISNQRERFLKEGNIYKMFKLVSRKDIENIDFEVLRKSLNCRSILHCIVLSQILMSM